MISFFFDMEAIGGHFRLYICVFTLPFLPSKDSGKRERTPHSCSDPSTLVSSGNKDFTSLPSQPPPAPGFLTGQSQRVGSQRTFRIQSFYRFSKVPLTTTTQERTTDRANPITSSSQPLVTLSVLPASHKAHSPPADCEFGGEK